MSRWTQDEDDKLRELAVAGLSASEIAKVLEPRTESAVSGRASALKVPLASRQHQTLREYLADGGHLIREEIGGVVGVRWAPATRNGGSFDPAICERFVALGFIAPEPDKPQVFRKAA